MHQLDDLDIKILTLLQENSKQSYREIAKMLSVSPPTVKTRVDNLSESGIIERFTIDLDMGQFKDIHQAYILIDVVPSRIDEISKELLILKKGIGLLKTSSSEYGLILTITGTIGEITELLDNLSIDGLNGYKTLFVRKVIRKERKGSVYGINLGLNCSYCSKEIAGEIYKKKIDEKYLYFCCETCERVFLENLERL